MQKTDANFFEIRDSFNAYWADPAHDITAKGQGYKAFKRWEWYWEPRVNADGSFPPATAASDAMNGWFKNKIKGAESMMTSNWTSLGPINSAGDYNGIGRLNCIAVHPTNTNIIFVGAAGGGLWKTTNGGTTWATTTDQLQVLGVSSIAIKPSDPNVMYIATGDCDGFDNNSVGILKSTDGGATFATTGLTFTVSSFNVIYKLLMDPNDENHLLAATNGGLRRSVDGGATWTTVVTGVFYDVEAQPGVNDNFYACKGNALYLSTNNGLTWTNVQTITGGDRMSMAVTPANNAIVDVSVSDADGGFLGYYRSTNTGASYTLQSSTPNLFNSSTTGGGTGGQGWYDQSIAIDPLNANNIFVGGVNTWKSTNGGTSWVLNNSWNGGGGVQEVHADKHAHEWLNTTTLLQGNDGGLYKTTNGGSSWTDMSSGLIISQLYDIGIAQTNNSIVAGLQDNSTKMYNNAGTWFDALGTGDGMMGAIDPTNPAFVFTESYYGNISRSSNSGVNWTNITGSLPDGEWVTPFFISPQTTTTMYIGMDKIYKTLNRGTAWTAMAGTTLASGQLYDKLVGSNSSANTIYASNGNTLYRTTDGGVVWTSHAGPTGGGNISDIEVSRVNNLTIWVTKSGYNAGNKVFKSIDGGATWTNVSTNLPNLPANTIVYQPCSNDGIYVGMDVGVYFKDNSSTNWVLFNSGLPNVEVTDLEIRRTTNQITAATYGRGVWQSNTETSVGITISSVAAVQIGCPTPTTGTITVTAATGTGEPLEYSKDNGSTWQASNVFSNLAAGSYNILVRFAADPVCTVAYPSNPVVIAAAAGAPVVTAPTVTQPACPSPATGTIVVNATGGGTLEYSINGGTSYQSSATFSGLSAGNYNIRVRLQATPGCFTDYSANPVVINAAPAAPVVTAPTVTQPACPTPATGTIVVNATGGTFEYSVNGGSTWQASSMFSGLAAGNYNIQVRFLSNPTCLTAYSGNPVVINNPVGAPVITAPTITQPACPSPATGTIVVNATGGGTLEYSINGGTSWQASATFSGLSAGNYNIRVRLQATPGCFTDYSANPVVINAAPAAPVVTGPTVTQPACPSPATGTIVVNATGGTFEYSVNGGTTWQASSTFSGLAAGNYNIQVRFQSNPTCLTAYSGNPVVINNPVGAPVVTAPTVTQPACPTPTTGTIVVNATGGTFEYSVNGGSTWQASSTFSGLAAGNYNIQVRFLSNPTCLTAYSGNPVVINNPVGAPVITAPTVTQPACPSPATGTIVVNATGGGTLEYSINGGTSWQASATFSGLSAGNYNIQVRLQATPACFSIYSANPVVINAAPTAPVVTTPTVTQPACPSPATGTIVVNATGGGTLEYSTNGGTSFQSSATFSGLSAGNYNIRVRLQATPGCFTDYSANPVVINAAPAAPVVTAPTVTQPACPTPATGTIVVNATGGTFEYSVNGGSTWQASSTFSGLAAGNYNIQVRFLSNPTCLTAYSGNPVVINNPVGAPVITAPTVTQPACPSPATGTIVVNATGGGSLEYSINGGTSWQASATFSGLSAGNYNIQVRLQATPACFSIYSANPVVINAAPTAPVVTAPTVTQPACPAPATGTIVVNATGGGTLEYSINGGTTWQASATFSGLSAGNYNIRVRLQATPGCFTDYSANPVVINAAPTAPVVTAPTVTQPACPTPATGTILVNATGGTFEYSVNGGSTWQASSTFSGLAAGNYNIRVRYVATPGCFADYTANPVVINAALSAPVVTVPTVTQPGCPTPVDGTIVVNATGGSMLEYSINGGTSYQASSTFTGLTVGNYSIRVRYVATPSCFTDYVSNPVVINPVTPAPVVNAPTVTQPACPSPATGTIVVNATGGAAMEFSINGGTSYQTSATFSGLAAGNYSIRVRFIGNPACFTDYSANPVVINSAPAAPIVNTPTVTQPACPVPVAGSILVNATGVLTLEYSINGGASWQLSNNFSGLATGNYTVQVRYQSSPTCVVNFAGNPVVINAQPAAPAVNAPTITQPACPSPTTGTILVNATGGGALEFSINGGTSYQTSASFSGLAAGNYSIRVRFIGNPACFTDFSANPVVINTAPNPPAISLPTITQPACPLPTTGTILVNSTGSLTMEYSLNGGSTWQASNNFTGLAPGSFNIAVRYQSAPLCISNYANNPVLINNTVPPTVFLMTGGGQYCAPGLGLPVGLSGSQTGFNYQLQRNAVNVGTPVAGTGSPISFGNQTIAGTYSVVATNPATNCAVTTTANVTVGTFTCAPSISDPCVCKNNATTLTNGQFDETIQVNAPNGQTWTVTAVTGLYSATSAAPPATPTLIAIGTTMTALGGNIYQLKGIHVDALGYSLTVSNGTTSLSIGNSCAYPNPNLNTLPSDNLCKNSPLITLTGNPGDANILGQSFTVDGQPATTFNPATATPGPHVITYTVDGGVPKAFGASDPGCIQSVSKTLTIVTSSSIVSCNDNMQVSLDEDCAVTVGPDMVLEGTYACFDDYKVVLTLPNGSVIPNATVNASHIGKVITATVTHIPSGNSCWGQLTVEDKLAPKITCSNLTVPCVVTNFNPNYLAGTLGFAAALPVVVENCGTPTLNYFDQVLVDLPCGNSPDHSARFVRRWTATDAQGNFSTCEQTIFLERKHGQDVKFPADVTIDCSNANTDPIATGSPYLTVNGLNFSIFNTNNVCEINSAFTDIFLPVCSGSYKILRTWTVYDWCLPTTQPGSPNPNPIFFTQVIMVKDQAGPQILDCPANFTVSVDAYNCSKNLDLPTLTVHDNCSDLESGWATFTNPATQISQTINATITPDPNWTGNFLVNFGTISGMPIGVHPVKFFLKDDCGNESTCSVNITIEDLQPPVTLCQEYTQIAIGAGYVDNFTCPGEAGPNGANADQYGTAIVPAATFNSGSYDYCGPVWLKVRRMQGGTCGSTNFNDDVTFCCSDINKEWIVVLRVYDVDPGAGSVSEDAFPGHWNDCMITAFVEDKVKPICQAPANKTVNCDEFNPLVWYGDLIFNDNCGIKNIDTAITYVPNQIAFEQCNYGQVRRAFTVSDCSNNSSRCTQTITVNYKELYRVYFPDDQNVTQCNGTVMNTQPVIFGENCELIGITHDDELFDVVPDACYKILRTWRVINWCTFNPNLPDVEIPNANTSTQGARIWIGDGWANYNPTAPETPTVLAKMWNYPAPLTGSATNPQGTPAYVYTQIIKVQDATAPQANIDPVLGTANYVFCDYSTNDPLQWNEDATYNPFGVDNTWSPVCQSHDLCEGIVDLSVFGTDDCTEDNVNFRYLLFLDLNGDGVMETTINSEIPTLGFGIKEDELTTVAGVKYRIGRVTRDIETDDPDHTKYAQFALPYGNHKIKWILEDKCGNDFTKEWPIEVKDCKNPTVVCINGLSINSMNAPVGTTPAGVTIWAVDFLLYAEDNCTDASQLVFALRDADINPGTGFPLDANGDPQTSLTWDCSQLGTNVVELWAMDKFGNADFCLTYLILTDNTGACNGPGMSLIAGDIKTKPQFDQNDVSGVSEVNVELEAQSPNPAFPAPNYFPTGNNGQFAFNALPTATDLLLTPKKDINPLNGVSTFDLVRMSKHVLNVQPFTTGYQYVAADINHNNQVTTFDIVELRKLILGIYTDFPANESWRFVDKNHVFDMAAPLNNNLPETKTGSFTASNDFIGVKIGDLTNDAIANNLMVADDRSFGTLLLHLDEKQVRAGEEFLVNFRAAEQVAGGQFTLLFEKLELLEIMPGRGVSAENFAHFAAENLMTASFNSDEIVDFTLKFRAKTDGQLSKMLQLSNRVTKTAAWANSKLETQNSKLEIALAFRNGLGTSVSGVGFELYQNEPNPFIEQTRIGFHLPEAGEATLRIFDGTGRLLHTEKGQFGRGLNSFFVKKEVVLESTTGLYYQVETATETAVKPMIRVR